VKLLRLAGRGWPDERGWAFRPLDEAGVEPARFTDVHMASVVAGAARGNHVHPNVTEWLLVFGAPATIAWRDADGSVAVASTKAEEPVLAEIPPGVAHAVRCDGPGTAFLVSWADGAPETEPVTPLL